MNDFKSRLPVDLYTAAQVRELDRLAIVRVGGNGFRLMQKAGSVSFEIILQRWPQLRQVVVFAGTGNNGGDGYVVAGLARQQGLNVKLLQVGDHRRLAVTAQQARKFADQQKVVCEKYSPQAVASLQTYPSGHTVVVDALLGTGLTRDLSGDFQAAVRSINHFELPIVALDIPSGIDSDTGSVMGCAVRADLTVTFIAVKRGQLTHDAVDYCGELLFHDLGVSESVYSDPETPSPDCQRIDWQSLASHLNPRPASSHKGRNGHVVILGGDSGFGGAVLMSAEAALRCGAGLVSVVTRAAHRTAILGRRPEVMVHALEPNDGADGEHGAGLSSLATVRSLCARGSVLVVGMGLGQSAWGRRLLRLALSESRQHHIPLVVDADGLNLLAELNTEITGLTGRNWILTPHPGEAARLLDRDTKDVQADRFAAISALQSAWGGVCLLKGAGSLICCNPDTTNSDNITQHVDLCTEGNPGMASAGMGDVLSGVIGAFVAQGFDLVDSLRMAVCVHGEAGDLAARDFGPRGMLATDLMPYLRQLVNRDS